MSVGIVTLITMTLAIYWPKNGHQLVSDSVLYAELN